MRPKNLEEALAEMPIVANTRFQVNCIVCEEPALVADHSSELPPFAVCKKCRKAILWARKHMEVDL